MTNSMSPGFRITRVVPLVYWSSWVSARPSLLLALWNPCSEFSGDSTEIKSVPLGRSFMHLTRENARQPHATTPAARWIGNPENVPARSSRRLPTSKALLMHSWPPERSSNVSRDFLAHSGKMGYGRDSRPCSRSPLPGQQRDVEKGGTFLRGSTPAAASPPARAGRRRGSPLLHHPSPLGIRESPCPSPEALRGSPVTSRPGEGPL